MLTIGLTGGIGSGKTTVADLFAARGVAVIDTDRIAHLITAPGGVAMPTIQLAFGPTVVANDGSLDRARMRTLVFSNPEAKARLEAITHPLIRAEAEREANEAVGPYLIFVVPLLVESGRWAERVDRVLVVDCPEAVQIERVMRRNNFTRDQVEAIMAKQATREARLAAAHDVILNDGAAANLESEVSRLHEQYINLANAKQDREQAGGR
ncbi:dephospho-CoA kinase [Pandoraea thiooxydans]|uniref:Dephospho-CoA kinase n=1 Tax=Pandoraea thiooxydans TaxID=445709 RepID=A0A0G3ESE6_9BURK|nr:dephospho-CoA kinase [Pandoraea thiooxydans]AKJ69973.1 dephospho-CoA kinase [Pandoraea thiooxydans]APR93377.1 dephospho-CoA kinase [Pandoraea thiooxydans]